MRNFIVSTITLLLILAAVGLGLWLLNLNFPATQQLAIQMVLGYDQAAISSLGPPVRLRLDEGYQSILEGPVYFDLRTVRWMNSARIIVEYQERDRVLNGIGGKVADPWTYDVRQPRAVIELEDGWQQATFDFDLNSLLSKRNVKRFVLDTTGETGDVMWIRSLKVVLHR